MSWEMLQKYKYMEYKYLVKVRDETTRDKYFLKEFLGSLNRNRHLNFGDLFKMKSYEFETRLANVYDGIMQPPDEDSKKSGMWANIKNIYKHVKRFYSNDMISKYVNETIEAMLYELDSEIKEQETGKPWSFDDFFSYLLTIYNDLAKFYSLVGYHYLNDVN